MTTDELGRARRRHTLIQFIKFGVVGGSGFLVNLFVAFVMNKLNGGTSHAQDILFPIAGTQFNFRFSNLVWVVAFLIANPFNFQLNRWWTFKSNGHASWWKEFWPFFLVGLVAAVVGFFVKILFTNPTSFAYLPEPFWHEGKGLHSREYWSQMLAVILTIPINFIVNKIWTFRAVRHLAPGTDLKD